MTMAEGDLAVTELNFVREAEIEARPPPMAMTGAFGWLRQNLLSTPFNIALTIVIALLLVWVFRGAAGFPDPRRGVERRRP